MPARLPESPSPASDRDVSGPVLALDTTGALGSVALGTVASARVRHETLRVFSPSNRHSRQLLPAIRELLAEAGVRSEELALIVATRGPGSFTGLRIGLATAQGFALALGIPAVGVSSLDAAALADSTLISAGNSSGSSSGGPSSGRPARRRLVLVDALRGEVFAAVYDAANGERPGETVAGPVRLAPVAALDWGRGRQVDRICGPALSRYRDLIQEHAPDLEVAEEAPPLAAAALRLGLAVGSTIGAGDSSLRPLYLREPDIHARSDRLAACGQSDVGTEAGEAPG